MDAIGSYVRLVVAGWFFVAGLSLLLPPASSATRRWDRLTQGLPAEQREEATRLLEEQGERNESMWRGVGILLGGIGFTVALHEAAYVCARYQRATPRPPA
jgi:hypothetical protein